jgi:hypothetical protein
MEVPGDRSVSARAVAATFGILAWISVSLRCYVRLRVVKAFGRDDGCMVVALVSYFGLELYSSSYLTKFRFSTQCSVLAWSPPVFTGLENMKQILPRSTY